jgi:hypothetical protein
MNAVNYGEWIAYTPGLEVTKVTSLQNFAIAEESCTALGGSLVHELTVALAGDPSRPSTFTTVALCAVVAWVPD